MCFLCSLFYMSVFQTYNIKPFHEVTRWSPSQLPSMVFLRRDLLHSYFKSHFYRLMKYCETFLCFTKWAKRTTVKFSQLQISEMLKGEVHFYLMPFSQCVSALCFYFNNLFILWLFFCLLLKQTVNLVSEVTDSICAFSSSFGRMFVFLILPSSSSLSCCLLLTLRLKVWFKLWLNARLKTCGWFA